LGSHKKGGGFLKKVYKEREGGYSLGSLAPKEDGGGNKKRGLFFFKKAVN